MEIYERKRNDLRDGWYSRKMDCIKCGTEFKIDEDDIFVEENVLYTITKEGWETEIHWIKEFGNANEKLQNNNFYFAVHCPECEKILHAGCLMKGSMSRASQLRIVNRHLEQKRTSGGCYIATAIYGSYNCSEVLVLRRFRDNALKKTWVGSLFIHTYYAISPTIVRWFGRSRLFNTLGKYYLDKIVAKLCSKEGN